MQYLTEELNMMVRTTAGRSIYTLDPHVRTKSENKETWPTVEALPVLSRIDLRLGINTGSPLCPHVECQIALS